MEVENDPLEDHEIHYKQVVFHFHVSSSESNNYLSRKKIQKNNLLAMASNLGFIGEA